MRMLMNHLMRASGDNLERNFRKNITEEPLENIGLEKTSIDILCQSLREMIERTSREKPRTNAQ